eukprot:6211859-Pleurochrysis_carterae.AAC.1
MGTVTAMLGSNTNTAAPWRHLSHHFPRDVALHPSCGRESRWTPHRIGAIQSTRARRARRPAPARRQLKRMPPPGPLKGIVYSLAMRTLAGTVARTCLTSALRN